MPDREKVIKGLEMCKIMYCDECPYDDEDNCQLYLNQDALDLLEEQEAVKPNVSDINDHDAHGSWWYQCGKCKMPIDYGDRFCRHCGRAVKWNETPGI